MKRKLADLFRFLEDGLDSVLEIVHIKPKNQEEVHYTKDEVSALNQRLIRLEGNLGAAAKRRLETMPKLKMNANGRDFTQESLDTVGEYMESLVPVLETYMRLTGVADTDSESEENESVEHSSKRRRRG
jgi:hypothetical protein